MSTFIFRRVIEPAANIKVLQYGHQRQSGIILLRLDGFLDNENTPAFLALCRDFLDNDAEVLGLDLKSLNYVSSTAVGAITTLSLEARRSGSSFFLCSVPDRIRKVIEMLGLGAQMVMVDDPLSYDYATWLD